MYFISAQEDKPFFWWQVALQFKNFEDMGIVDKCHTIFGYNDSPSDFALQLSVKYNVHFYKDTREDKTYHPSIRPHLIAKFMTDHPECSRLMFLHDSDIIFNYLPDSILAALKNPEVFIEDGVAHLSNTISYIGSEYLLECGKKYKEDYPELEEDDLLKSMAASIDIDPQIIKDRNAESGGAQLLLIDVPAKYWQDQEQYCYALNNCLKSWSKKYKSKKLEKDNYIQVWCAEMWAVLWGYWKKGGKTMVVDNLDFSWANDSKEKFDKMSILHVTGLDSSNRHLNFDKTKYVDTNVLDIYYEFPERFKLLDPGKASYQYFLLLKEYVKENYVLPDVFFLHVCNETFTFYKDFYGYPIYVSRSFAVFFNGDIWVITHRELKDKLKLKDGGILFGKGCLPQYCQWHS